MVCGCMHSDQILNEVPETPDGAELQVQPGRTSTSCVCVSLIHCTAPRAALAHSHRQVTAYRAVPRGATASTMYLRPTHTLSVRSGDRAERLAAAS